MSLAAFLSELLIGVGRFVSVCFAPNRFLIICALNILYSLMGSRGTTAGYHMGFAVHIPASY